MAATSLAAQSDAQWRARYARAAALPLPARIAYWAALAAPGAVYTAHPLGEGTDKLPEPGPLSDFTHVDCVTYVEQVYALALSRARADFPDVLRRIRYRDGQVDFRWRNHYTVSDWLPANAWFIHDITDQLGPTRTLTKTISRAKFFSAKGLAQYADIPDETAETRYLPRTGVEAAVGKLHAGDMIIFVVATPGIIAGHVGLMRVEHGVVCVQHASQSAGHVVTSPLTAYLRDLPERFIGWKVARVVEKS